MRYSSYYKLNEIQLIFKFGIIIFREIERKSEGSNISVSLR